MIKKINLLIISALLAAAGCGGTAISDAQKFVPNKNPEVKNITCTLPAGVTADSITNDMTIKIAVMAEDPEGKALEFSFTSESGIFGNIAITETGCTAELYTRSVIGNGAVYITVTAKDEKKASDTWGNFNVGTGRSGPKVDLSAYPRNYIKPSADTEIVFSSLNEGYYQIVCDNSATEDTIAINYDEPVYMYMPSGDAGNPKEITISVAGLTSTNSGRVKLPTDNAPNKVWLIFWDGLKQYDTKCFIINQDSISPRYSSFTPSGDDVGVRTTLGLVFDEAVLIEEGGFEIQDSESNKVTSMVSVVDKIIQITFPAGLNYYEKYTFNPLSGAFTDTVITDLAGNILDDSSPPMTGFFTTQALGELAEPVFLNAAGISVVADNTVFSAAASQSVKAVYQGGETGVSIACTQMVGGTPGDPGAAYTNPDNKTINFSKNTVIKAAAFKKGYKPSIRTFAVRIRTAAPVILAEESALGDYYTGVYNSLDVNISGNGVQYSGTYDGSEPGNPSTDFTAELRLSDHGDKIRIKALAQDADMEPSEIVSGGPWTIRKKLIPSSSWQIKVPDLYSGHAYAPLPFSCIAADTTGQYMAAAVTNGYIYTSVDGGNTWIEQTGAGQRDWRGITVSDSQGGVLKVAAAAYNDHIYISTGLTIAGNLCTWPAKAFIQNWTCIYAEKNGTRIAAGASGNNIYYSLNSGVDWYVKDGSSTVSPTASWTDIVLDSSGIMLAATSLNSSSIYYYNGTDWFERAGSGQSRDWYGITANSDFTRLTGVYKTTAAALYNISDIDIPGLTYGERYSEPLGTAVTGVFSSGLDDYYVICPTFQLFMRSGVFHETYYYTNNYSAGDMFNNGNGIVVTRNPGYVETGAYSSDHWTFSQKTSSGSRKWIELVSSENGQHIYAVVQEGSTYPYSIYYSGNYGLSFDKLEIAGVSSTPLTIDCTSAGDILFVAGRTIKKFGNYGGIELNSEGDYISQAFDYLSVACNMDGTKAYITRGNSTVYTYDQSRTGYKYQSNSTPSYFWHKVKCAKSTGQFIFNARDMLSGSPTYTKYGWRIGLWSPSFSATDYVMDQTVNYKNFSISNDGNTIAVITNINNVYRYNKNGGVFNVQTIKSDTSINKSAISVSTDGSVISYTENPGYIQTSYNSGATWDSQIYSGQRFWSCIATPQNGLKIIGGASLQRGIVVVQ